jgi:hypothetical protein
LKRVAAIIVAISLLKCGTAQAVAPIPSPRQTGVLRANVNATEYLLGYGHNLGPEVLVADFSFTGENAPDDEWLKRNPAGRTRETALRWLKRQCPNAIVGTYISSRAIGSPERMEKMALRDPPSVLPSNLFKESELLSADFAQDDDKIRIVDYRQPVARAKLVRYISDFAKRHKAKVLYTDNWSHDASWPGFIPWSATLQYMQELTAELHRHRIVHICNVAVAVGGTPLQGLSESCDGASLEMPALEAVAKAYGPKPILEAYAQLAKANCRAILIPNPGDDGDEARFLAGVSALGNFQHYVGWPAWKELPEWYWWPASLGNPTDKLRIEGTIATRKFQRGTIVADFAKRTVEKRDH